MNLRFLKMVSAPPFNLNFKQFLNFRKIHIYFNFKFKLWKEEKKKRRHWNFRRILALLENQVDVKTLCHLSLSTFSAPFFIKHLPRTIEVMEGTNVRLDCILRGGVELVQWSQEGADQSKRDFESEGFEGDFVSMGDRPQGAASKPSGKSTGGGSFKPFKSPLKTFLFTKPFSSVPLP